MISAIYNRDTHCLIIKGHAYSAEYGHDLVCASASMLTYTLASFVDNMVTAGQLKKHVIRLDDGEAEVSCKADAQHDAAITLVFDSICAGLELLAREYPKHIKYEIKHK